VKDILTQLPPHPQSSPLRHSGTATTCCAQEAVPAVPLQCTRGGQRYLECARAAGHQASAEQQVARYQQSAACGIRTCTWWAQGAGEARFDGSKLAQSATLLPSAPCSCLCSWSAVKWMQLTIPSQQKPSNNRRWCIWIWTACVLALLPYAVCPLTVLQTSWTARPELALPLRLQRRRYHCTLHRC